MSPALATNEWSNALKTQTRDMIDCASVLAADDGQLHLKHLASDFGTIVAENLHRGVLKLVEWGIGAEFTLASADKPIAAGWVID